MSTNYASIYRQTTAQSASPTGGIVMLYNAAIQSLYRAERALQQKNVQERVAALNHVLSIVEGLEASLDFERGGDVAHVMVRFYSVTRGLILKANAHASAEGIRELIAMFNTVREGWQQVGAAESRKSQPVPPKSPSQDNHWSV